MPAPESHPSPSMRHRMISVRGEEVPVTVFEPGLEVAARGDLLFLHGYARDPVDYRALLGEVVGRGWRVVAPFLYCNNRLRRPPRDFWACASLTRRTVEGLRDEGLLDPTAPAFGHSTGGAVALTLGRLDPAPAAILALNPVQPSLRSSLTFMARSTWMHTKLALGLAGEARRARALLSDSMLRYYGNLLRDPVSAYALIGGLRAYTYDRLARWYGSDGGCVVPTRVIYGTGDEFYPSSEGLEAGLRPVFERFDLVVLDDQNSHEWMLIRQERAADELERFLAGG